MYSLSEIKTIKDEYEVEEVNCLERPVALLLHSFNPIYRNIYLMFEKMNRCYNLDYYADINYRDMISMQRATVVLKKEMDIQIKRTAEEIDIHDFVIDNISKNNPVIVPGNLKKLYYSKFYNKADWIHSFFVYGFDSENELYMVFDSVQCEKEKEMHKFVIPKDVLKEMYKSFCNEIYKEGIYYIESADVNRNLNCREVFYNGMYQFVKNRKQQTFVEIDLIEDMFRLDKVKNDDVIKLLEINNFKKVFLNELVTLLEYFDYKEKDIDKLKQINRKLLDSWKVGESKIAYYLRKKKE